VTLKGQGYDLNMFGVYYIENSWKYKLGYRKWHLGYQTATCPMTSRDHTAGAPSHWRTWRRLRHTSAFLSAVLAESKTETNVYCIHNNNNGVRSVKLSDALTTSCTHYFHHHPRHHRTITFDTAPTHYNFLDTPHT